MAKFSTGVYTPKNPQKYIGKGSPTFRSSWEHSTFRVLDEHSSVTQWASESLSIPYQHPFTGKWTFYIPDLLIIFVDKTGKKRAEVVEIKPAKETFLELAKSKKDKMSQAVNQAKWKAAMAWCFKNGLSFRILTENELFGKGSKKK